MLEISISRQTDTVEFFLSMPADEYVGSLIRFIIYLEMTDENGPNAAFVELPEKDCACQRVVSYRIAKNLAICGDFCDKASILVMK